MDIFDDNNLEAEVRESFREPDEITDEDETECITVEPNHVYKGMVDFRWRENYGKYWLILDSDEVIRNRELQFKIHFRCCGSYISLFHLLYLQNKYSKDKIDTKLDGYYRISLTIIGNYLDGFVAIHYPWNIELKMKLQMAGEEIKHDYLVSFCHCLIKLNAADNRFYFDEYSNMSSVYNPMDVELIIWNTKKGGKVPHLSEIMYDKRKTEYHSGHKTKEYKPETKQIEYKGFHGIAVRLNLMSFAKNDKLFKKLSKCETIAEEDIRELRKRYVRCHTDHKIVCQFIGGCEGTILSIEKMEIKLASECYLSHEREYVMDDIDL